MWLLGPQVPKLETCTSLVSAIQKVSNLLLVCYVYQILVTWRSLTLDFKYHYSAKLKYAKFEAYS